jgi:hypothetical protein
VRDALFGQDGSVVTVELDPIDQLVRVVRHLADGSIASGWPWTPAPTDASMADIALGPDNSVYVIGRADPVNGGPWHEALHRLDASGHEMPGFPVVMQAVDYCGLHVAGDGRAVVSCEGEDTAGSVTAITPDGTAASGWPVKTPVLTQVLGVRHDGAVLLGTQGPAALKVSLLGPDGRPVPGWHRRAFSDTSQIAFDDAGRIRVVSWTYANGECAPILSTTYTVLAADGRSAPGWPITVKGWGSVPVVRADGSMVATTSGHGLDAWSLSGRRLRGWPTSGVDIASGCNGGSNPAATGDGGVVVVGHRSVTRFTASGAVVSGWPVRLPGTVAIECRTCTPGPAAPLNAGVTAGKVFVAVYLGADQQTARIVGLNLHGRPLAGFPKGIGKSGDEVAWLRTGPDGRVWALLLTDTGGYGDASTLVPLTSAP